MINRNLILVPAISTLLMWLIATSIEGAETHVVSRDESLWTIAKRYYGHGHKWKRIHVANMNIIKNPDHIRAGQRLIIPDLRIANADIVPAGYVYWKTVAAKITAYYPGRRSCYPFADGKTSIGKNAWIENGCAVDPSAIPYGTMVKIKGVGFRVADDTGRAMKRSWNRGVYHIDIRFKKYRKAKRFGVKKTMVTLYKKRKG